MADDDAANLNNDVTPDSPESATNPQDGNDNPVNTAADDGAGDSPAAGGAEGNDNADNPDGGGETPPEPGDEDGDPENPDKSEDPKEKARREYQERQERRASKLDDRVAQVVQYERKVQSEIDPEDPDARIKRLESNDRIREANEVVREVRSNQQALRNDHIAVEQIDFFKERPDALKRAQDEFANRYLLADDETGEILGAYDPRTGQPVSYHQFMLAKAEEYAEIASTSEQRGITKARQTKANADPVGGASRTSVETNFEDLPPEEMAKRLRQKGHEF